MFAIEVTRSFYATHALRLPDGSLEPPHAHDFRITARIAADQLDALETVADFHDIEKLLDGIISPWHHGDLNAVEPFRAGVNSVNPSAERIAEHIGRQLQARLPTLDPQSSRNVRLLELRVTEAHDCLAIWSPN